jgi:3-dehydroquinate dehydratase/shikimate dehydrogenase
MQVTGRPAPAAAAGAAPSGPLPTATVVPSAVRAAKKAAGPTLICTSVTATTVRGAVAEIAEAGGAGATAVELRLDFLTDLMDGGDSGGDPAPALRTLLAAASRAGLPAIVTFRPAWEGGQYAGPEPRRLATLKLAALLGAAFVDVEAAAAGAFFAGAGEVPPSTRVILSHHDYVKTPPPQELVAMAAAFFEAGADVAKIATTAAGGPPDAARVLSAAAAAPGPTIALAMGEAGLASRVLAPKYGAALTFGALSAGRASAPGQPSLADLVALYRLGAQTAATAVFGVLGNPVSHSRSPAIHNAALEAAGVDGVYLPFLVDDLPAFLAAFDDPSYAGFSVTIPHKAAALAAASEADPTAALIGAANTLVRLPGGGYKAYNTDADAAVDSIADGLRTASGGGASSSSPADPLHGATVLVLGAGGAGRAVAFGAAARGARVTVANRGLARAQALAADVSAAALPGGPASAVPLEDVAAGRAPADVLANTTSVGMAPHADASPVPARALGGFRVVFDAVYTPLRTRLLAEAAAAGCVPVDGLDMFCGQAAVQFKLFTGVDAPAGVMRAAALASLEKEGAGK